jgi:hypothetical protein
MRKFKFLDGITVAKKQVLHGVLNAYFPHNSRNAGTCRKGWAPDFYCGNSVVATNEHSRTPKFNEIFFPFFSPMNALTSFLINNEEQNKIDCVRKREGREIWS